MSNYLKSFVITITIYSALFAVLIFSFDNDVYCKEKTKSVHNRVCISMIVQEATPAPKKVAKPQKPKPVKKAKPVQKTKKIVKKVPKPDPKPVEKILEKPMPEETLVKKEESVIKKEELKTEVEPIREVKEDTNEEERKQKELQAKQAQILKQKQDQELQARQDQFMAYLVEKINSNKSYPHMARKRSIEGDVKVMFHIFADGSVQHIKLLSGRSIFKRSAFEAIKKSFPIEIDKTLFSFPKEFTVTLAYNLTN